MAPSFLWRLTHPADELLQGLPSSTRGGSERPHPLADKLNDEQATAIDQYLAAVSDHREVPHAIGQLEHVYSALSILDSKAQALLQFNSFLLVVAGVYFGTITAARQHLLILILFILTVVGAGASCLLCLDVVWVHWLGQADLDRPATATQSASAGYRELVMLRDERTRHYRLAWYLAFCAVITVLIGAIVAMSIGHGS